MSSPAALNNELAACPFCGGTDIFVEPDEWGSGGQWVGPIHVGCTQCKAEQMADFEETAIAAWNRRVPAPASVAELQADIERRIDRQVASAFKTFPINVWRAYCAGRL